MLAAVLVLDSWMGPLTNYYEGENVREIISQFQEVQSLECLANMAYREEGKKGRKEVNKIYKFLDKVYDGKATPEDLRQFSFRLSIGGMKCLGVAETPEEIEALHKEYDEKWAD